MLYHLGNILIHAYLNIYEIVFLTRVFGFCRYANKSYELCRRFVELWTASTAPCSCSYSNAKHIYVYTSISIITHIYFYICIHLVQLSLYDPTFVIVGDDDTYVNYPLLVQKFMTFVVSEIDDFILGELTMGKKVCWQCNVNE